MRVCVPAGKQKFRMFRRAPRTPSKSNGYNDVRYYYRYNTSHNFYCSDRETPSVVGAKFGAISQRRRFLSSRSRCAVLYSKTIIVFKYTVRVPLQPRVRLHAFVVFAGGGDSISLLANDIGWKRNAHVTIPANGSNVISINVTILYCHDVLFAVCSWCSVTSLNIILNDYHSQGSREWVASEIS